MPKVPPDYKPQWKQVRVRAREAGYVGQVAEEYQEDFIDALYRIINFHRDSHLVKKPRQQPTQIVEKATEVLPDDYEPDTDLFE